MSDHNWVFESLDAYVAGGLTAQERNRVERHLESCDDCARAKAEIAETEHLMEGLFTNKRPDVGLEDRAVQTLRKARRPRPSWLRFVTAAAAVIVLGITGAIVQMVAFDGSLPIFGEIKVASTVIGGKGSYRKLVHGTTHHRASDKSEQQAPEAENSKQDKKLEEMVNGKLNDAMDKAPAVEQTLKAQREIPAGDNKFAHTTSTKQVMKVQAGYFNDGVQMQAKLDDNKKFFENRSEELKEAGKTFFDIASEKGLRLNRDQEKVPDVAKLTVKDVALEEQTQKNALEKLLGKADKELADNNRGDTKAGDPRSQAKAGEDKGESKKGDYLDPFKQPGGKDLLKPLTQQDPIGRSTSGKEGDKAPSLDEMVKGLMPPASSTKNTGGSGPPVLPVVPGPAPTTPSYAPIKPAFQPMSPPPVLVPPPDAGQKGEPKPQDPASSKSGQGKDNGGDAKPGAEQPGSKTQPKEDAKPLIPDSGGRKIIRSGEMEYETDSFKGAVLAITKLVRSKGGFVATINSDQLPNGKVKGSIIVRMPPAILDEFLLELPGALPKSVLKNQRIGSQDVTKSYTDIESRLRAARAIEERLIQIIKTPKSEVKDLLAAERELATWRTKIEEMEGEIRYLSNQVSLSTLTIQLYEKEIEAPSAIVITETVTMRIEVDDVGKSHKATINLVKKLEGRLTRSDLKQHPGGQLISILHAEIPPKHKDEFLSELGKLGMISDRQEMQSQHAEGGSGKGMDIKQREGDVCFQVTMNNTANIKPSMSVDLKIASTDVAGYYTKLLAKIKELGGQVRDGKLNEQDKNNINAYLDFNVPSSGKAAADKLLDEAGLILERVNLRAQVTEVSTDRKFGYIVVLRDFANIPARQSVVQIVGVSDVPASYQKLQDAIAKVKGHIADAKINEQDKLNVFAQIDFSVAAEEKKAMEKLIEELGFVLVKTNFQAPMNVLTTPKKFGFSLVLRDYATIPASKSAVEVLAVTDVPVSFAKIQDAVIKAKGQMVDAKLNEQDKLNVTGQLNFSVPAEAQADFEKLLEGMGTLLSRSNEQMPANMLSTPKKFGFVLILRDFATIPPSKAVAEVLATSDVPTTFAKIQDAIVKAKGMLVDARLNEQDKLNITASLSFSVPIDQKQAIEKVLEELATRLSRSNEQMAANVLSTPKKFGFAITLRDFVGIPPAKAVDLKVATNDVPASYAKLLEVIAKAKGQVVDAKLNEQDRFNITAQVDFSVPTDQKQVIDDLLAGLGSILSRNNTQAPMTQLTLAKKFGYSVALRDFANILPTHAAEITVAANNVQDNYARLIDAIVKAKGQLGEANLNETDKLNILAVLKFTVPVSEKPAIDKMLDQMGTLLSRKNVQAPLNSLTTEKKFGYSLVLRDFLNIPPRETFHIQIAAVDVPESFRKLQNAVAAAKGLISVGKITEENQTKIEAMLDFNIPSADRQPIEELFGKVGAILGKTSSQVSVNDLATDVKIGYRLTIKSTNSMLPRETVTMKLEVKDVDGRASDLKELVSAGKGRILDAKVDRHENGQVSAELKIEVPFASQDAILRQIKGHGILVSQQAKRNQVPENELTTSHIVVTLIGVTPIVPSDEGLSSYVRTSLYMSFKVFSVCLMLIILGVSAVLPWVLVIYVAYKIYSRITGPRTMQLATATGSLAPKSDPPST